MIATSSSQFTVVSVSVTRFALLAVIAATSIGARAPLAGEWGGRHVKASLSATGGMVELECASVELSRAIAPDRSGRFTVQGLLERAIGPKRVDRPLASPVSVSGQVNGDQLVLVIRMNGGTTPRRYQLRRNQPPVELYRCL
jgi:hypothetical protein